MNSIYKKLVVFLMSAPLFMSTTLNADNENQSNESSDMTSSVSTYNGAQAYDGDEDEGATAYQYTTTSARKNDEGDSINSAEVYIGIYNNGKEDEDQYTDARVVLQAGLDANAMCSPCGSSISLFELKSGGNESQKYITYQSGRHSFIGQVNMTNSSGVGVYDVAGTILDNETDIATNSTGIATNVTNIATNTANIATNTADIATNKTNIATNTADIATNVTDIATNTADIATNGLNITANTNGIASNLALIGSNRADINSLSTNFTNFQEDTRQNFATLSSNTHKGLAEVTAISNVAYASSGWRASIGYGNYESKSAAAIGISYAGEKAKFKLSTSGDALGAGVSFDF